MLRLSAKLDRGLKFVHTKLCSNRNHVTVGNPNKGPPNKEIFPYLTKNLEISKKGNLEHSLTYDSKLREKVQNSLLTSSKRNRRPIKT